MSSGGLPKLSMTAWRASSADIGGTSSWKTISSRAISSGRKSAVAAATCASLMKKGPNSRTIFATICAWPRKSLASVCRKGRM